MGAKHRLNSVTHARVIVSLPPLVNNLSEPVGRPLPARSLPPGQGYPGRLQPQCLPIGFPMAIPGKIGLKQFQLSH